MYQYQIIDLSKYAKTTVRICIPAEKKIYVYSKEEKDKVADMVRLKFGTLFNYKTRTDRWVEISEWLDNASAGSIYDALPHFTVMVKEQE